MLTNCNVHCADMSFTVFEKKSDEDTYINRLGAAKRGSPSTFYLVLILTIAALIGLFYANFRAMGLVPLDQS